LKSSDSSFGVDEYDHVALEMPADRWHCNSAVSRHGSLSRDSPGDVRRRILQATTGARALRSQKPET